jgi:lipopolysaccharide biosynthesis regulator YciM
MRKFLYIASLLILLPLYLDAQTATVLLQKVSGLLSEKKWDAATDLFQQAVGKDVTRAEIYFRAEVDKQSPAAISFAERLAVYYKNTREYTRAYNFYKMLLASEPDDATYLSGCAESAFGKGNEEEAVMLYDKVINLNSNNLRANIFLGSYFFMKAEGERRTINNIFKKIANPTTMQKAHYKDELKSLYTSLYHKSKNYLDTVTKTFHSAEAKKMLVTIAERQAEME